MLEDRLLNIVKDLKNSEKQVIQKITCKNVLGKVCFAHDATYSDGKDLAKKTISDTILKNGVYDIAMNTLLWWISKRISKHGL